MAMNNILGLFAHSPLKPLQKHSKKVTECCDLLVPFFKYTFLILSVPNYTILTSLPTLYKELTGNPNGDEGKSI